MNNKIDSLILRSRIFLGATGVFAICSIAYYLLFNVNVAAVIKANAATQGAAFGIAFPVLAAFIIAIYSFIDFKNIQKLSNMQTVRRSDGGFKTKKMNKEQKKAHNATVNHEAFSITGIFVVSIIVLAYWIYFICKLGDSFSYLHFGNYYIFLVYKYMGSALLVLSAITSGLATYFARKIKAFNY